MRTVPIRGQASSLLPRKTGGPGLPLRLHLARKASSQTTSLKRRASFRDLSKGKEGGGPLLRAPVAPL